MNPGSNADPDPKPNLPQSPDEIDLPPLDPELLDHQRRRQVL